MTDSRAVPQVSVVVCLYNGEDYVGAAIDFRPTNDFGVAGCAQTLPSAASCPSPKPTCE